MPADASTAPTCIRVRTQSSGCVRTAATEPAERPAAMLTLAVAAVPSPPLSHAFVAS